MCRTPGDNKIDYYTFALKSSLEGKSIRNLIQGTWANIYEVYVVVVIATTLLLKQNTQVYDWASKEYLWGAEFFSRAGCSCYYSENSHLFCLNSCIA